MAMTNQPEKRCRIVYYDRENRRKVINVPACGADFTVWQFQRCGNRVVLIHNLGRGCKRAYEETITGWPGTS